MLFDNVNYRAKVLRFSRSCNGAYLHTLRRYIKWRKYHLKAFKCQWDRKWYVHRFETPWVLTNQPTLLISTWLYFGGKICTYLFPNSVIWQLLSYFRDMDFPLKLIKKDWQALLRLWNHQLFFELSYWKNKIILLKPAWLLITRDILQVYFLSQDRILLEHRGHIHLYRTKSHGFFF